MWSKGSAVADMLEKHLRALVQTGLDSGLRSGQISGTLVALVVELALKAGVSKERVLEMVDYAYEFGRKQRAKKAH
jgi:hypothetical protein